MSTDVAICSNALILLGDSPINNLNDGSTRASLCLSLFPFTRDAMMRAHAWDCCIKRVVLSPTSTAPVFGFGYAFNIPGDCLRVLSITDDEYPIEHRVEGTQILTNTNSVSLRYIYSNEVVTSWDAGLTDVMISAMAAALAYPITRSDNLKQMYDQEVFVKLRSARNSDAQQGTTPTILSSPLVETRSIG